MRFNFAALFVTMLASSLFLLGLPGDFVLDDSVNILQNHLLYVHKFDIEQLIYAALSFHDGNGSRALPMLSFALDHLRAGNMDPSTFKATNLLIHALTTFILIFFFRRLLLLADLTEQRAAWGALALAFIWAIHPLQVSSVLYIVQRMQTMVTLFIVLALWAYLAMRQAQISGGRGRLQGILLIVCWALALTCKEDAILLPLYTLILELTILRFKAGQAVVAKGLRQSYSLFVLATVLVYFLLVVPHYWSWDTYPGRDFSSTERLLTQGRVLVMYIGQILWPLPNHMPFIYDHYHVSRSLWQPLNTLPAILLLGALFSCAWVFRVKRPLFACGVLLFFAGHFITSNIIALELVFEHRNHLPLIGAVLALGDLSVAAWQRLQLGRNAAIATLGSVALLLAAGTLTHTYTWGDGTRHGKKMTELSPNSIRAWNQYATVYFRRYNITKDTRHLGKATEVTEEARTYISSPSLTGNILIYKSIMGTVNSQDWQRYYQDLREAPNDSVSKVSAILLIDNVARGYIFEEARIVEALEILAERYSMTGRDYMQAGVFIYKTNQQNKALPFFKKAIQLYPKDDPIMQQLIKDLSNAGHDDWVDILQKVHN
ncbi:hypothetical protein [Denitrificimonas caeni]|uniref:hypothetical protein n=1 Tax=Denitrificimonas caeni TaxID=521720 RepID=UPI0003B497F5|nr:hypothetical protein [Denitrificimonas caeni]